MKINSTTLSEKQELLLSRYHDGELGFWSARKAKSLLSKSKAANQFVAELTALTGDLKASAVQPKDSQLLWNGIANRIEQEERNSLYLGERRSPDVPEKRKAIWESYPILSGLGAATAAFMLGIIFQTGYLNQNSQPAGTQIASTVQTQTTQSQAVRKLASNQINNVPISLPVSTELARRQSERRRLEIDWVKSDGRVEMIGATEGPQIIWVRRPKKSATNNLNNLREQLN